VDNYYCID